MSTNRCSVHISRRSLWLALGAAGVAARARAAEESVPPAVREAADRFRTKIVVLKGSGPAGRSSATGFLVQPGVVLTAAHFVKADQKILAWLNGVGYPAHLRAQHPSHDLALLTLDAPALLLKPADISDDLMDLDVGEQLLILTGPSQSATARGEPDDRVILPAVYHQRRTVRGTTGRREDVLILGAQVQRGDSGSPVIRVLDHKVVGVTLRRELEADGESSVRVQAAPADLLHAWLTRATPADADDFYLKKAAGNR